MRAKKPGNNNISFLPSLNLNKTQSYIPHLKNKTSKEQKINSTLPWKWTKI